MDHHDTVYLIWVIQEWAKKPENAWFNTKFIDAMEARIFHEKFTIKQKKALLNIHNKCLKKEFKGACISCIGSPGMMYYCEGVFVTCPCSDKFDETLPPQVNYDMKDDMDRLELINITEGKST